MEWDITKLKGPARWTWFYLYVLLDVFSRYVAGWMVATKESAALAERLIADTVRKEGMARASLTVHADRGSSMTSKPVALLLADLGIAKTHSRPHTSNDNPYSEAQFKTLKYRPGFPRAVRLDRGRAGFLPALLRLVQHAPPAQRDRDAHAGHRHSGIAMHTPATVHHGRAVQLHQVRVGVLADAYAAHPERFVKGLPRPRLVPAEVWINRPAKEVPQA